MVLPQDPCELFPYSTGAGVRSRDGSVGIATGYELDERGVGVRVP
jgi:hypothetical protein